MTSTAGIGFPPIARPDARILILGSMPGIASLEARRYYAHPRNAFWPIMGELLGFAADLPYEERATALLDAGVALWDVLHSCRRQGSLDAAIEPDSVVANDFTGFFADHPEITHVFCNGRTAESSFRKEIRRQQPDFHLPCTGLPSTSPAHAGASYAGKLASWRVLLPALGR
jgi:hypoxanthine-DNA glycosylase